MRFLGPFTAGIVILIALNRISFTGFANAEVFAWVTLFLLALLIADSVLFRHQERISPFRVYLAAASALLAIGWAVYALSFLPPGLLFAAIFALAILVTVLTLLHPPNLRQKREDAGLCPQCGYDLRASEERCPECNAPMPESIKRRRRAAEQATKRAQDESARERMRSLCLLLTLLFSPASQAAPPPIAPYDPDPNHLWNRLHQTLFVRTAVDGEVFGIDSLDPPLFAETTFLLKGPSHSKALAILDEFLNTHGEKLIDDPLKIAALQRDLWFAFDWAYKGNPLRNRLDDELDPVRVGLREQIGKIIGRLRLKPAQIAALPDNYAAAVKSGRFAASYDSAHPDRAFLPGDLTSPESPWVAAVSGDTFAASFHVKDFGGRYAFDLFINLPAGRAATIAYLQHPWPALPRGTQMLLLRRPLLIDTDGKLHATALIESAQMRIFRQKPRPSVPGSVTLGSVPNSVNRNGDDGETDFFEVVRSRPALFAGQAGGLRAVPADEKALPSPVRAHLADSIQRMEQRLPGERARTVDSVLRPALNQCIGCHKSGILETAYAHLVPLEKDVFDTSAGSVIRYKAAQNDWRALSELMNK